jgi:hypothetical protein
VCTGVEWPLVFQGVTTDKPLAKLMISVKDAGKVAETVEDFAPCRPGSIAVLRLLTQGPEGGEAAGLTRCCTCNCTCQQEGS